MAELNSLKQQNRLLQKAAVALSARPVHDKKFAPAFDWLVRPEDQAAHADTRTVHTSRGAWPSARGRPDVARQMLRCLLSTSCDLVDPPDAYCSLHPGSGGGAHDL